jgi:hypothetical protein
VPYIHCQAVLKDLFDTEDENTIICFKHWPLLPQQHTVTLDSIMHQMKYNKTQIINITFMIYLMICINCILTGAFVGLYIEASEVLCLERSFIWCRNLNTSGSRSETPGKF